MPHPDPLRRRARQSATKPLTLTARILAHLQGIREPVHIAMLAAVYRAPVASVKSACRTLTLRGMVARTAPGTYVASAQEVTSCTSA